MFAVCAAEQGTAEFLEVAETMTFSDRLGKFLSRKLYRLARRFPGEPSLTNYKNLDRVAAFNRRWPWSWGK